MYGTCVHHSMGRHYIDRLYFLLFVHYSIYQDVIVYVQFYKPHYNYVAILYISI